MTSKALIKKGELLRMANIAKEFGVVVEHKYNGIIVRVAPHHGAEPKGKTDTKRFTSPEAPPDPIQPPFDHRELVSMERLVECGVGAKINCCTIRTFGPRSRQKLLDRGYIEVVSDAGCNFKDEQISLTKKGLDDWKAMQRHRSKHPYL